MGTQSRGRPSKSKWWLRRADWTVGCPDMRQNRPAAVPALADAGGAPPAGWGGWGRPPREAAPTLVDALKDPDAAWRGPRRTGTDRVRRRASPRRCLKDPNSNSDVRRSAAGALAKIGPAAAKAMLALVDALKMRPQLRCPDERRRGTSRDRASPRRCPRARS